MMNDGTASGKQRWVVDLDLEKFFDTVNHDVLMHRVRQRVQDDRVTTLVRRFLKSGVSVAKAREPTTRGTPQGGPLSPLLANLLLDELDRELERRRHRFVRYADDCNIYVGSRHAGERVMASIKGFLERRLKLTANEQKSAVDRPWNRRILGFTFTRGKQYRRKVSDKALDALKAKVRRFTQRTRGYSLEQIIRQLRPALLGWKAYFGYAEVVSPLQDLDRWIRRKLRCYQWKQWDVRVTGACGRSVCRESWRGILPNLRMGHGRLSRSPALAYALTHAYFTRLGLPTLA